MNEENKISWIDEEEVRRMAQSSRIARPRHEDDDSREPEDSRQTTETTGVPVSRPATPESEETSTGESRSSPLEEAYARWDREIAEDYDILAPGEPLSHTPAERPFSPDATPNPPSQRSGTPPIASLQATISEPIISQAAQPEAPESYQPPARAESYRRSTPAPETPSQPPLTPLPRFAGRTPEQRLENLADFCLSSLGAEQVLVIDRTGRTIVARQTTRRIVAAAAEFFAGWQDLAAHCQSPAAGFIEAPLADQHRFYLIAQDAQAGDGGALALGLMLSPGLNSPQLEQLRAAFAEIAAQI